MDKFLVCQVCGERISANPYCTCTLGEHLLQKHQDLDLTFFLFNPDSASESRKQNENKKKNPQKRVFYKTTVESWKEGPLMIKCPQCLKCGRPCIRKQKNKVAQTSLGAFFMLTCWPLCFLPFLMTEDSSNIDLYCKYCGYFLGEYDRRSGLLKCRCESGGKKLNLLPCE